jgi:hypothetical protein
MLARERLQGFVLSKDPNRKYLMVTFALVKYLGLLTLKEILEKGD